MRLFRAFWLFFIVLMIGACSIGPGQKKAARSGPAEPATLLRTYVTGPFDDRPILIRNAYIDGLEQSAITAFRIAAREAGQVITDDGDGYRLSVVAEIKNPRTTGWHKGPKAPIRIVETYTVAEELALRERQQEPLPIENGYRSQAGRPGLFLVDTKTPKPENRQKVRLRMALIDETNREIWSGFAYSPVLSGTAEGYAAAMARAMVARLGEDTDLEGVIFTPQASIVRVIEPVP